MDKRFLSFFTLLLLICSINFVFGANENKEVTIMIPLYQETNEEYTLKGNIYNYGIRLVEITKCDKDLYNGSCINTIELNILQKDKYNNEIKKTVVVPDIIKVRDIPMTVEFEDIKFNSIFVTTIYFDQGAANFKISYTDKDVLREMVPVYSGEMIDTPLSIYMGETDKLYSMVINRSESKLIVNVKNNTNSETHYGVPDDIISFNDIKVKVLNQTNGGIKFTVYSTPGISFLSKSEIVIRKGESFNVGGIDFKVIDTSNISATLRQDNQDYLLKKRSVKTINGYLFELNDIGTGNITLNVYHPKSINVMEYGPNVVLKVTKKIEYEEGEIFEIPFTIANTGKADAEELIITLQGSGANIIDGSWRGLLKSGETKDLIFKAKYNESGNYIINFNVNSGQSSESFQEEVNIKSKITAALTEGPMQTLIFITRNYIVTQDRIKLLQSSITAMFFVGVLLSGAIIAYSSMQTLPKREIPRKKISKKKISSGGPPKEKIRNDEKIRRKRIKERR